MALIHGNRRQINADREKQLTWETNDDTCCMHGETPQIPPKGALWPMENDKMHANVNSTILDICQPMQIWLQVKNEIVA